MPCSPPPDTRPEPYRTLYPRTICTDCCKVEAYPERFHRDVPGGEPVRCWDCHAKAHSATCTDCQNRFWVSPSTVRDGWRCNNCLKATGVCARLLQDGWPCMNPASEDSYEWHGPDRRCPDHVSTREQVLEATRAYASQFTAPMSPWE